MFLVLPLNKSILFWNIKSHWWHHSTSYFIKIYKKGPCLVLCFFSVIRMFSIISWFHMKLLVHVTGMTYFIVRDNKKKNYNTNGFKLSNLVSIPWLTTCGLVPCSIHFLKCIFHEKLSLVFLSLVLPWRSYICHWWCIVSRVLRCCVLYCFRLSH